MKKTLGLILLVVIFVTQVEARRQDIGKYPGEMKAQILGGGAFVVAKADKHQFTTYNFGFLKSDGKKGYPAHPTRIEGNAQTYIFDVQGNPVIKKLTLEATPGAFIPPVGYTFEAAGVTPGGTMEFMNNLLFPEGEEGYVCGVVPTLETSMTVSVDEDWLIDHLDQNGMVLAGGKGATFQERDRLGNLTGRTFKLDDDMVIDMKKEEHDGNIETVPECSAQGFPKSGSQRDQCILPAGHPYAGKMRIVDEQMGCWLLGTDVIEFLFYTDKAVGLVMAGTGNVIGGKDEVTVHRRFPVGMDVEIRKVAG